jgi:hypothetical protein
MRKTMIALAMLGAMIAQVNADQLDTFLDLKNRGRMISAIAILMTVPPKCLVDNKTPSNGEIGLFIISYGYHDDFDAFFADVKAQMKTNNEGFVKLSESAKAKVAELICGYAALLSIKVRDVARSNGKQY